MNQKKIWIMAIVFGIVMSTFFYLLTSKKDNKSIEESIEKTAEEEVSAITDKETVDTLSIQDGKRAISLAVDEVQSVSGFIRPGSYIDVIAVYPSSEGNVSTAQVILNQIKVLAVGKTFIKQEVDSETTNNPEDYQTVTLEVEPGEGAIIALAKENGTLTLMLSGTDEQKVAKVRITLEEIKEGKMTK